MERIKPTDLENAELKRTVRGYDIVETHKLLQKAAQEIATLNYEMRLMKAENEKLAPLKDQATAISDVIVTAQKTAEDKTAKTERECEKMIANAKRECDQMITEAHSQCEEIEEAHKARLKDLKWDIERTTIEKDNVINVYKAFLQDQLNNIDDVNRNSVMLAVIETDYVQAIDSSEVNEAVGA